MKAPYKLVNTGRAGTLEVRVDERCALVHVETPLAVVNIFLGLADRRGRKVESVQILPDAGVKLVKGRRLVKLKNGGK